jgi:hypothetical protein
MQEGLALGVGEERAGCCMAVVLTCPSHLLSTVASTILLRLPSREPGPDIAPRLMLGDVLCRNSLE